MDYFSKALGSLNIGLNFTVVDQDPVPGITQAIWKKDGRKVSVFESALKTDPAATHALSMLKKLLLIPGVVRFVDSTETLDTLYVVTERVSVLDFSTVTETAAQFLASCVVKTLQVMAENTGVRYHHLFGDLVQNSAGFPVLTQFGNSQAGSGPILSTAEWESLIATVFVAHPALRRRFSTFNPHRTPQLLKTPLQGLFDELPNAAGNLEKICIDIESSLDDLWPGVVQGTVLPALIATKSPAVLRTVLKLLPRASSLDPLVEDFIAEQFASMDRVVRLEMLRALPEFLELLPPQFVQTKIMPKMAFGFVDSEVVIRRASVASIETLAPKLSSRQLNSELLRLLAKTHNDKDADVRALTTTVICKIAPLLTNKGVVSTALGRALKDPAPKCRSAALQGVLEIQVPAIEIAEKLLGPAAAGMLDKDQGVSSQAWRVTEILFSKIQSEATASSPSEPVTNADTSVDHIVSAGLPVHSSRLEPQQSRQETPSEVSEARLVEDAWGWDENDEAPKEEDAQEIEDAWGWNDDD